MTQEWAGGGSHRHLNQRFSDHTANLKMATVGVSGHHCKGRLDLFLFVWRIVVNCLPAHHCLEGFPEEEYLIQIIYKEMERCPNSAFLLPFHTLSSSFIEQIRPHPLLCPLPSALCQEGPFPLISQRRFHSWWISLQTVNANTAQDPVPAGQTWAPLSLQSLVF